MGNVKEWNVFLASQNLASVLNDPKRGKQRDLFTKTWGESFIEKEVPSCPFLPEIKVEDFTAYLKKTSKRYKKHLKQKLSMTHSDSAQSTSLVPCHNQSSGLPNISVIPKIFLQPTFDLSEPETFQLVLRANYRSTDAGDGKTSSIHWQEELSQYLDVVEMNIARHISQKSEAFFHAMSSHDILIDRLQGTIAATQSLREKMHVIQDNVVFDSVHLLRLKKLRQNYVSVLRKLELLQTLHQTQPTIQLLLSTSEFLGALDLISTTQEVLVQELPAIRSFRHLGSQLAELKKVIGKMLEADFRRYVTLDLYRPISEKELDPVDENWLQSIVFGLFRQKSAFLDVIRDEACTALEAASKEVLAEALAILPHEQELSQDEARQQRQAPSIRNLSAQALTDLLSETCQQLFLLLKRVKMLMILVAEMTALAAGREKVAVDKISSEEHGKRNALTRKSLSDILDGANLLSSEEYEKVAEGLKDVLCQSCDYAHERCARLLREMPSKLSHAEFLNIANIVQDFCQQTEELTHQKSSAMVLALQTQGAKVASRLHEEQKVNLTLLLESEQWKPTEVPAELQKLVDDIVFAGSFELNKDSSYESKPKKSLSVAGEDFTVVGVVLLLVKIMSSYSVYAKHCQFLTPDLLSRLTELLQFYNSRVCQLLLGAEARTRAGLRSITARHLALGWRSLQLIQSLIPYFQKHFLPLLASANKSNPFSQKHLDLVNRDFKAHSEQLSSKLVNILTSTFEIQLKQWEPKPPVPSNTFRSICKQLAKFHEAVEDVLPTLQVKELLLKIHEDFSQKCRWHLNRLGLASDGGPQHALVTAELTFYMQQLQGLKCMARCDSFDKFLSEVFCR